MRATRRPDGKYDVTQSFIPPTVYLDHWAIRGLTDNPEWQDRFVQALHKCGGTLVLSYLAFAEFAQVLDPRHAADTERFLDRVLPNVFFASIALDDLIKKELRTLDTPEHFKFPPIDAGLTEVFITKTPSGSFVGMIQPISTSGKLRDLGARMNRSIARRINEVRKQPAFIKASKTFKAHEPRAPALTIFRELARIPATDQRMKIDKNDGSDLQHALFALAYCDFALLDRKWVDFAARTRRRLSTLKIHIHVAQTFSKRDMPLFLDSLEKHPNIGAARAV